jgi:hypothetical protein
MVPAEFQAADHVFPHLVLHGGGGRIGALQAPDGL